MKDLKRCSTKYNYNQQWKPITQPNIVKIKSQCYESVYNKKTDLININSNLKCSYLEDVIIVDLPCYMQLASHFQTTVVLLIESLILSLDRTYLVSPSSWLSVRLVIFIALRSEGF